MKERRVMKCAKGVPSVVEQPCRLVASKEEAEMAKVIAKETKPPFPVNQGSFTGRTR